MGALTDLPGLEAIAPGEQLLLDTSALIVYLKGDETASPLATQILDGMILTGRNSAIVSAISVSELLVRPIGASPRAAATVRTFLVGFPNLSIRSCDFLIAAEAANIRAKTPATTPDALIAATATLTSCPWLVTNDRTLRDHLRDLDWQTRVLLLSDVH